MIEFLILDQTFPKNIQTNLKVIRDPDLWKKYLDELCRLRGRVYIEEGLYAKEILTADGRFEEKWDSASMHTIAMDDGKVVGALRITLLSEKGHYFDGEIEHFVKKLNLKKHGRAFHVMLHDFGSRGRKVIEISRLIIAEEYRRFRSPSSKISIGLFTLTYLYFLERQVNDVFIIQGNKYKTGRIYEKIGFTPLEDIDEKKPLEPFLEFDDICLLLYFDPKQASKLFMKFINEMREVYLNTTVVVKEG